MKRAFIFIAGILVALTLVSGALSAVAQTDPFSSVLPPPRPLLAIPAYSDSAKWYHDRSPSVVRWVLPEGVTGVGAVLNQAAVFDPIVSDGLVSEETFVVPEDGVWYLHVRFQNMAGWGETAHARIAVDTVAPTAFSLRVDPASVTDEPTVTVHYESSDDLSGMDAYEVLLDVGNPVRTKATSYAIADLRPGTHVLSVDAIDQAGNKMSASEEIRILPIASPTVGPLPDGTYAEEAGLQIDGTGDTGTKISVDLLRQNGDTLGTSLAVPDETGAWTVRFERRLSEGNYVISAVATDVRGAKSFPAQTAFSLEKRPFLTLRGIQISRWWFDAVVFGLIAFGFLAGWEVRSARKERRGWFSSIARRDATSAFDQIQQDVDVLSKYGKPGKITVSDLETAAWVGRRLRQRLKRVRQYVLDSIRESDR